MVLAETGSAEFGRNLRVAESNGIPVEVFGNDAELRRRFPNFHPLPGTGGILETGLAGMINPRRLIQAQKAIAQAGGCKILDDVVCSVSKSSENLWKLQTKQNRCLQCRHLLVCPGAFLDSIDFGHLTTEISHKIDLKLAKTVVTLIRMKDERLLAALGSMPSLVYSHANVLPGSDGWYMLPPIKYPDGHWYLKIGPSERGHGQRLLADGREAAEYFRSGPSQEAAAAARIVQAAKSFIPSLDVSEYVVETCVRAETGNRLSVVMEVSGGFVLAGGGNGWAAKSSDELARLAARLLLCLQPESPLDMGLFRGQHSSNL